MSSLEAIVSALSASGDLISAPETLPAVTGVVDDSRVVQSGDLFCAVTGTTTDGHGYVGEAVQRGAAAVMVTRDVGAGAPQIVVRDSRQAVATAATEWFDHPARALRILAVTGTNGKTTCVALTRHLLNGDGDVGGIGTLGATDGAGKVLPGHDRLTTPGTVELQQVLRALCDRGCRSVVMEASSHALDQGRLAGVSIHGAVFTNLTHEHLDYHESLEDYRAAKLSLLELLEAEGFAACNADDVAWAAVTVKPGRRVVRFGVEQPGDVRATVLAAAVDGSTVEFRFGDERLRGYIPLPGAFNVSNATAAAAAAWAAGLPPERIVERLRSAPQVPGRMERLVELGFVVIRDYAHTPDALERLLLALRPTTEGRLIVLFGAGGDRDRTKRPQMGAVAERLADLVVVTSDNPRTENPDAIIDDIVSGMDAPPHRRMADRREAICATIGELGDGDCLVLAGKGHETYQVIGAEMTPFDERKIVQAALADR